MRQFLLILCFGLLALDKNYCFGKQICYKDVGCFSDDAPWDNMPLPSDPEGKSLRFLLKQKGEPLREITSVRDLKLDDLIITTHGFGGDYNNTFAWNNEIITNLHEVRPTADIVFVEWAQLAELGKGPYLYHQPASNARLVAEMLALWLKESPHFDSTFVYCIGFSLGAHVCGLTAKRLGTKFGRISAIDPAGPAFIKDDPVARVDVSDGIYVDVMHTSWLGLKRQLGHKDFYVNDANIQPGCTARRRKRSPDSRINGLWDILDLFSCSHYRAAHLFARTIIQPAECTFLFCKCPSREVYDKGYCRACDSKTGALLGYRSIESQSQGTFYGVTSDKDPFCAPARKLKH